MALLVCYSSTHAAEKSPGHVIVKVRVLRECLPDCGRKTSIPTVRSLLNVRKAQYHRENYLA